MVCDFFSYRFINNFHAMEQCVFLTNVILCVFYNKIKYIELKAQGWIIVENESKEEVASSQQKEVTKSLSKKIVEKPNSNPSHKEKKSNYKKLLSKSISFFDFFHIKELKNDLEVAKAENFSLKKRFRRIKNKE